MYTFEDINHEDVKSFIVEFGYGSCHLLSQYLSKEFSKDIGIIRSSPSGMVIHSFIYLNDDFTFDAHGIDQIENTIKRYESFSAEYNEDSISVERFSPDAAASELSFWCSFDDNDENLMKEEFKHLDLLLNIKEKIENIDKLVELLKEKDLIANKTDKKVNKLKM